MQSIGVDLKRLVRRRHLFDGKVQIATAPEFRKLVKDMQEKHRLEEQKEARAEERKKADANAALNHWKSQLVERYNEDMASYSEECATLAADGVPKKFWPKKPSHLTRGKKANQLTPMSLNSPPPSIPTTQAHRTAAPVDVIVAWAMGLRAPNMRTLRTNSMYNLAFRFLHMYSLLYVIFCNFYNMLLPLIAAGPVTGVRGNTCQF